MSFEEKSVWIQLIALVTVLVGYAIVTANMFAAGVTELTAYMLPFITAIVLVVVLTIIGHVVAALPSRPEGRDERDRFIEQKARMISSHVLEVGAVLALLLLVTGVNPLWSAHLLFLSLFLEEIVRQGIQIGFYRRGV